ncbi:MAG: hypothetical protein P4L76_01105, partial [Beijerinckiaceae bacterium]|nr:hypothetical protein [Beijerinckiaceae bacterium]
LMIEIVLILSAITLIWANHDYRWHERWIFYRLLAELCRKQMMLSPVGRTLPAFELDIFALGEAADAGRPRAAWVGWYLQAVQRQEYHQGSIAEAKQNALELGRRLARTQVDYHHARKTGAETADRRLTGWIEFFFVLTTLSLVLRLFGYLDMHQSQFSEWVESTATLFSSASAALVGLRTYGEFSLLEQQSSSMERLIRNAAAELDSFDTDIPLSSQDIASALQRLAVLMMQEVQGWVQLFSLKSIDSF